MVPDFRVCSCSSFVPETFAIDWSKTHLSAIELCCFLIVVFSNVDTFRNGASGNGPWPCRTAAGLCFVRRCCLSVFEVVLRAAQEIGYKRHLLGAKFELAPLVLATSLVASHHMHKV